MTTSTEPPATDTGARLPGFFIVGHSKSGTTALYEMLKRHPQLYLPDFKEPSYFAADLRPRVPQRVPEPETLEEYLRLFEGAAPGQLRGRPPPCTCIRARPPRRSPAWPRTHGSSRSCASR